jgi:Zn-dependent M16 (insulinase) family peptidase
MLTRELKQISEAEEHDKEIVNKLQERQNQMMQQQRVLKDAIGPIKLEHDKVKFIIEATAPHLLRDAGR